MEGRNRIGGRIHTVDLNTYQQDHTRSTHSDSRYESVNKSACIPVDLGAAFIHGCDLSENEAYKLCDRYNIIDQLQERVDGGTYTAWYTGKQCNDKLDWKIRDHGYNFYSNIDNKMLKHAQSIQQQHQSYIDDGQQANDINIDKSMKWGFDQAFNELQNELKSSARPQLSPVDLSFLISQSKSQHAYVAEMSQLSLRDLYDIHDIGVIEGPQCLFTPGCGTIPHTLASRFKPFIKLNTHVQQVQYNHNNVVVTDSNGVTYNGDYIVCTASIGCLKKNTIEFIPKLPLSHQRAIDNIGMGVENKIILQFKLSERFWPSGRHWTRSINHPMYKFVNLDGFGVDGCLLALIPPPLSITIESQSDELVLNNVLAALRDIFGKVAVNQPINYIVTRWGTDPYSYGSYHYIPVGSGVFNIAALAEPIENRLYFGGEATSVTDGQTVHGALGSGIRVAKQIITHAILHHPLPASKYKSATKAVYPLKHYRGVQPCQPKSRSRARASKINNANNSGNESEDGTGKSLSNLLLICTYTNMCTIYIPTNIAIDCYCADKLVGGDMVQCEECDKWYHIECLHDSEYIEHIGVWSCPSCIDKSLSPYSNVPWYKTSKSKLINTPFAARYGLIPCAYITHPISNISINDYVDILFQGKTHSSGTVYALYQPTDLNSDTLCDCYVAVKWDNFSSYHSLVPIAYVMTQPKNEALRGVKSHNRNKHSKSGA